MNPTTLYQSAILEDDNHASVVREIFPASFFYPSDLAKSTSTQAVKSTTPFTPEFVQAQLTLSTNRSRARAQALYDERVRRRQLVLTHRKLHQHQRRKEKEKETKIREMMGRREAAEKGLWRLRKEEARCVFFFFFALRGSLLFIIII
jgi:hypothetical protein